MKIRHWICLILTLCGVAATGHAQTEYYAVFADGKKMGHAALTRKVDKDKVTTTMDTKMSITRGEISLTVRISETTIETKQGKPLGFEVIQDLGMMVQKVKGTVTADGKVTTTSSGMSKGRTVTNWPAGAVMSEGARLLQLKKGLKEGTIYAYKEYAPSMQQAMAAKVQIGPTAKVDLFGRVVTLTKLSVTMTPGTAEITSTMYVDKQLRPQKTIIPMMGMTLEMIACNKAFALSKNDVVDFLAKCVLRSPTRLVGLSKARSARYHLQPATGQKLRPLVVTDNQTVKPGPNGSSIVTVRPIEAPAGAKFPYKGKDAGALAALKPAQFVQSDHKGIIKLARRAVGDAADAADAARRIEAHVRRYITTKSLSVGYASAAEVLVGREGDCSEHAVLAAAMCRAVGIPARVVFGYTYAPKFDKYTHVFVPHAWVETHIGGKWTGLDAAQGTTGAGHLAVAVGSGDPAYFFDLFATLGRFKITKVTVQK